MKKWMIAAAVMVLMLFVGACCNAESAELSGSGWSYSGTVLTITDNIQDYHLLSSSSNWYTGTPFEKNGFDTQVTEIVVKEGVTKIGDMAFYRMSNLTKVTFPSTLRSIGSDAFMDCTHLTEVTIPASVTFIGHGAFHNCQSLKKITFEGSAPTIGTWDTFLDFNNPFNYVFSGCTADVYYKPYSSWTASTIAAYSSNFYPTWHMVYDATGSCGENASWYLIDGDTLVIKGSGRMEDYYFYGGKKNPWNSYASVIKSVSIANGITYIGDEAFRDCTGLTHVSIPDSVTYISNGVFCGCTSLESVNIPNTVTYMGMYVFEDCSSLASITIPDGIAGLKISAFKDCTSLKIVTIPDGIDTIGQDAFWGCTSLESITIPPSVRYIYNNAFYNCNNIESVYITDIESWLKLELSNEKSNPLRYNTTLYLNGQILTDVVIPDGITAIRNYAFYHCHDLTSVSIPDSVTSIGAYAFCGCSNLKSISIPKGVTTIGNFAFNGCSSLADMYFYSMEMPQIGGFEAFAGCTPIIHCAEGSAVDAWAKAQKFDTSYMVITAATGDCGADSRNIVWTLNSDGLLTIEGSGAMKDYDAASARWGGYLDLVKDVEISDGITAIGDYAFAGCSNLKNITVPLSVNAIGDNAFADCGKALTIDCHADSCAALHAAEHAILTNIEPHEEVFAAGIDVTCTTDGITEGNYCAICEKNLSGRETIAATGHNYDKPDFIWAEDGSECTAGFICLTCGYEHHPEVSISSEQTGEPDCVNPGETTYTATVILGEEEVQDPENPDATIIKPIAYTDKLVLKNIPELGHTEATIPGYEPTCTESGKKDYIFCIVCDTEIQLQENIPALGHSKYVSLEAIKPTCADNGRTQEISCNVCYEVLTKSETIPMLGHKEYVSVKGIAPDCENTGLSDEISCSVCSAVLKAAVTIPEVGHKAVVDKAIAPDCENTGLTEGSHCSVCGKVLVAQEIMPEYGHKIEIDKAVEPTDRKTGLTEGSHCTVCSKIIVEQKEIAANFDWDGDTVTAYNGSATEVHIPDGVTALGDNLFKNNTNVKTVYVPDSVLVIGKYTFFGCTSMTDIYLPDHLTSINIQCFYGVKAKIHTSAHGTTALALSACALSFTIEDGMTLRYTIESADNVPTSVSLIEYSGQDLDLILPDNINGVALTQISSGAFASCDKLKSVWIPSSVKNIVSGAFGTYRPVIYSAYDSYARKWAQSNDGFVWKHDKHSKSIIPGIEPTCTDTGLSEGTLCSVCGEILVEPVTLEAKGHTVVIDKAVKPTENESGLTEGSHCAVCGKVLVEQNTIPPLGNTTTPAPTDALECLHNGKTYNKSLWYETPEYTYADEKGHYATGNGQILTYCAECGECIGKSDDQINEYQIHGYNDGICVNCSYKCTHSIVNESNSRFIVTGKYEARNDYEHAIVGTCYRDIVCAYCGLITGTVENNAFVQISDHKYNDGICVDCGMECAHNPPNWADFYERGKYTSSDVNYHKFTCVGYRNIGICDICYEIASSQPIKDGAEWYEPHSYIDGICSLCRFEKPSSESCEHLVCYPMTLAYDIKGYEDFGNPVYHNIIVDGYVEKYCNTCGVMTSSAIEKDLYHTVRHCFDDNGICTECGHVSVPEEDPVCQHKNVEQSEPYFNAETQEFVEITEYNHVRKGSLVADRFCPDCNTTLEKIIFDSKVTLREPHGWAALDKDVLECEICHYELPCTHNGTVSYVYSQLDISGYTFSLITDTTHCATGVLHRDTICDLCNTIISSETLTTTAPVNHTYNENDVCRYCGFARKCNHANMVVHEEVDETTLWGYPTYTDITIETHTLNGVLVVIEDCPDCDYYKKEVKEPREVAPSVRVHTFRDGICIFCSYKNTGVTPEPTTEPVVTPEPTMEPTITPSPTPVPETTPDTDFIVVNNVLTGYTGNESDLIIPDDLGIIAIGDGVFMDNSTLISVTIPDGVTIIGSGAFENCINLEKVNISGTVTRIDQTAFYNCISLKKIVIPEGVTYLGWCAFGRCTALTDLSIPASLRIITNEAFASCESLTRVEIPEGIKMIDAYSFIYCYDLVELELPESLIAVGADAFRDSKLAEITIPAGLNSIGADAFGNKGNPDLMAYVYEGTYGQEYCEENNIDYELLAGTPDTESDPDTAPLTDFVIKDGVIIEYVGTGGAVIVPDGVTGIGDSAFADCKNLTSVKLPYGVTSIGNEAFNGCSLMIEISIPDSVMTIGYGAFNGCSSLKSVLIPESVTRIETCTFNYCTNLKTVSLPSELNWIGNTAFNSCKSLTEIVIPDGVTSIESLTFNGCSSLKNVSLPDSLYSIGDSAFGLCKSLNGLTIPASVTEISDCAYANPDNPMLTNAYHIVSRVAKDSDAHVWCVKNRLPFEFVNAVSRPDDNVLILPKALKVIDEEAFMSVNAECIVIPDGATTIGNRAFANCKKLTCIIIPGSVTSIAEDAFSGCNSLTIFCERGSAAYGFAAEHGIPIKVE